MTRDQRRILSIIKRRGLDGMALRGCCILASFHGIEYALRAAEKWPVTRPCAPEGGEDE